MSQPQRDRPRLVIVAAVARNRVIGNRGTMPWHLPEDLKLFRSRTLNTAVLMGRRTHLALGRPLDSRHNVVLSREPLPGVETYPTLEQAFTALNREPIIHIIGGAQLFASTINIVDAMVLSLVDAEPEGDAYFPKYEHLVPEVFAEEKRTAYKGFEVVEFARRGRGKNS